MQPAVLGLASGKFDLRQLTTERSQALVVVAGRLDLGAHLVVADLEPFQLAFGGAQLAADR
jgi:hypothetical protein